MKAMKIAINVDPWTRFSCEPNSDHSVFILKDKQMVLGTPLVDCTSEQQQQPSSVSVTMIPTPCFYPQPHQPAKWVTPTGTAASLSVTDDDSPMSRYSSTMPSEIKYDPAAARFAVPAASDMKYPSEQFKYPTEMRWPTEFPYHFPFHTPTVTEPYPTDPFPSTSVALPAGTYRVDGTCYYPNAMIPPTYAANPSDYLAASQQLTQWRMPAVPPVNAVKSSSSTGASSSTTTTTTSPPYRTGPGTNNVRVRTSEKYRMVYSDYQRLELEKEFRTTQFINSERKSQLSSDLQLTERQIKIWFQNRRAKDRRDSKKSRVIV